MKLFAPIQIQESKDGGYAGGSPILPAGDYQGTSRMEVAEQLYSSLCRTIQSSKSRELVNTIEEHEAKEEFDYIQVDFFSRREHFLLCFLWFILILALFTGLYTLGSFIYYQFHTHGLSAIEGDVLEILKQELLMVSYAKAVFFLIFWNLFYYLVYPKFLCFWAQVIFESDAFHGWYSRRILSPLGLNSMNSDSGGDQDA